ncbi:MAG: DUF4386 domain-containing protein [Coriobacteriia bacterium]
MTATRRAAITAGALFLVGTAAGALSVVGAADGPDYLRLVAANGTQVTAGALFQCITAGTYAGVAIVQHPVLRRHSPGAAAGFLGFRIAAGILNMLGALVLLLLLDLSGQFVGAGAPPWSYFHTLGSLLRSARDSLNHVAMMLAMVAGDALYYSILLRTRLVPRWLSVWGFVGLALVTIASLLVMFRVIEVVTPGYAALMAVFALQQLALAIWLIGRGFDIHSTAMYSAAM